MPQPIDPNSELGRLAAVERVQQIADRASLAAQARLTSEAAREQVVVETQVRQMNPKNEQVDEELRRRNPFMGRRQHPHEASDEEKMSHRVYNAAEKIEVIEDPDGHELDVII
jgi:hypothetical protein